MSKCVRSHAYTHGDACTPLEAAYSPQTRTRCWDVPSAQEDLFRLRAHTVGDVLWLFNMSVEMMTLHIWAMRLWLRRWQDQLTQVALYHIPTKNLAQIPCAPHTHSVLHVGLACIEQCNEGQCNATEGRSALNIFKCMMHDVLLVSNKSSSQFIAILQHCTCACVCMCVHACVRACVHEYELTCIRACVHA